MLNLVLINTKVQLFFKNNMYFVNYFCFKLTKWTAINTNLFVIYMSEKYILEYWIKNLYKNFLLSFGIIIISTIQITFLYLIILYL